MNFMCYQNMYLRLGSVGCLMCLKAHVEAIIPANTTTLSLKIQMLFILLITHKACYWGVVTAEGVCV